MREDLKQDLMAKYSGLLGSLDKYGMQIPGDGWYDVLDELFEQLDDLPIILTQVKEKFGMLRVYYTQDGTIVNAEIEKDVRDCANEVIHKAEEQTKYVCIFCGTDEEIQKRSGWVHYSCDDCERRYDK